MEKKTFNIKNKISQAGFALLIFFSFLQAHPVNLTKMDFNISNGNLHLRFVSFNVEKVFHKNYENESEIKKDAQKIMFLTQNHLHIYSDNKLCKLKPVKFNIKNEIVIDEYFKVICKNPENLKIKFDLFFNEDPTQIGTMKISYHNKEYILSFNDKNRERILDIKKEVSFLQFLKLGIIHILEGIDHITFLLMLLLPAVMFNKKISLALKDILLIVTAFTLSHSTSLILSAYGIVMPPAKIIEILIAFTILLAALNNIFKIVDHKKEWIIAFLFGFIHGFAFSEAIRDLRLEVKNFLEVVLAFNIGVEIGQIIVVLITIPIFYLLIKKYPKTFYGFSFLGALLAFLWMIDRIFGLNFMPF
ncbi:HupE/UreJ family protein [Caminibacter pacificus]